MNAKHLRNLEIIDETGAAWPMWGGNPFHFIGLDGAGVPPVRRITRGSPLQHGILDRGVRLQPRTMTLSVYLEGATERETDTYRELLAYIFGPTNGALKLRATKIDGTARQIDCYVDGTLDFPMSKRIGTGQLVDIPLLAQDPIWYNPTKHSLTFTSFVSGIQKNINVTPIGITWADWPVFTITGPADTLRITSGATNGTIVLNRPVPAGETFVIDLRPNRRVVYRASDGANRMSYVDKTTLTAIATFTIYPEKWLRILFPGLGNFFTYNIAIITTAPSSATTFTAEWYDRYVNL